METTPAGQTPHPASPGRGVEEHATVFAILCAISLGHFLNDVIQALLPSIYPVLRDSYKLSYTQVGLITLTFQCTASLLQPLVGLFTDRRPQPWSLPVGMALTLTGLVLLSRAGSFPLILLAAGTIGIGSSVFHPEASRIAYMAAGRRRGLAQSLFQVGGNAGSSAGPLLAAWIILPGGQASIAWFTLVALAGIVLLGIVGRWQRSHLERLPRRKGATTAGAAGPGIPRARVVLALLILAVLVFSKYFYLVSLSNYYQFYLHERFGVSDRQAQYFLFLFLFAIAAGTILGGPVGDRIGRKRVIWFSILGVAPFSLALPYAGLPLTAFLTVIIGLILASAFSAILVYAQELLPGRVGMIAGLFFGFAFGMAGIGAALLGHLADHVGIIQVFHICAWLPLLGVLTAFLPETRPPKLKQAAA